MKPMQLLAAMLMTAPLLIAEASSASAADILIKCEKRAARSKVSVDAGGLEPGNYRSVIISGTNARSSPYAGTIGDEIEFDFDSKAADIAAGATSISSNFIQNGTVFAKVINAAGRTVISDTALCRVR
jgi:hypothetical protein